MSEEILTAEITVEAVSVRNRSIKTSDNEWVKLDQSIDPKAIRKGESYTILFKMVDDKPVIIECTPLNAPGSAPEAQPAEQPANNNNVEQAQNRRNDQLAQAYSRSDAKELRITRLAAIERAISYLQATKGVVFSLAEVFSTAEQITYYAYHGLDQKLKMELTGIPAAVRRAQNGPEI